MEMTKILQQNTFEATLSGKFTFNDHSLFREVLEQMTNPEVHIIIVDLKKVTFVDSAALGMFLLANDEAKKSQKRFLLRGAGGQVKKMFDMARFETLFQME